MTKKKSEIVVSGVEDASSYLILKTGITEIQELIEENLGDEGLAPHELDRAGNPSGKSTKWSIPTIDGDEETVSEITGVILYNKFTRNRWLAAYGEGEPNARPVCSSIDGRCGVGDPGGICKICPFAQFGSAKNNSQACKKTRLIFVLRESELLPLLVTITPGNLKSVKKYFRRLLSQQISQTEILSTLSLTAGKSKSGHDYAVAGISLAGKLDPQTAEKMKEYSDYLKPWLKEAQAEQADIASDEEDDPIQPPKF